MGDGAAELPLSRQCELAEVPRATVYWRLTATVPEDAGAEDLLLCRLLPSEPPPCAHPWPPGRRPSMSFAFSTTVSGR